MAAAFAPSSTFSESQVKRAPDALAREGRLGSPDNWCETVPCSAMRWACLRAAMARASSDFRDGNPCALRSWFTALNSSRSASEEFCCARPLAEQRISKALSIATRYGIRIRLLWQGNTLLVVYRLLSFIVYCPNPAHRLYTRPLSKAR